MAKNQEIKELDEVTSEAHLKIPVEQVTSAYEAELKKLGSSAKIKGFRPGKAPKEMIEKMYGGKARFDIVNRLVAEAVEEVAKSFDKDVVGQPELDLVSMDPEKPLEFKAKFSFFPKPEIKSYDKIKVKIPKHETDKKAVDKAIENIQKSKATVTEVKGREELKSGDVIKAQIQDAEGDDELSDPEPINLPVGEGYLPEDLEKAIIGLKIGETKETKVKFPKDHPNEGLQGKTIKYKITLEGLSERALPEANDAFAKSLGYEGIETLLELRTKLSSVIEEDEKKHEEAHKNEAVLEHLADKNSFVIPEVLVNHEIKKLAVESGIVNTQEVKFEDIDVTEHQEQLGPIADKRVRHAVILDRIAEQEDLVASREDYNAHLESTAKEMNVDLETLKNYYSDPNRSIGMHVELTRKKVIEFLDGKTEVEYEGKCCSHEEGEEKEKKNKKKK